jgi:hypothetical protein
MANLTNLNNKFLVQTGGNVGINKTSPEEKLDIAGSVLISNNEFYKVEKTDGTNYKIAGLTNGNVIQIGAIDYTSAGTIFAGGDNISITTGGAAGTTRIKIDSSGNVGIGTTSPYAFDTTATKLHVKNDSAGSGNVGEVARFEGSSDADGSGGTIRLGTSNDRGIYFEGGRTGSVPYGIIGTTEYNGAKTYSIYLQNTGNVGIGTESPSQKLHIEGLALIKNNTSGLLYLYDTSNSIYGDINGAAIVTAGNNLRFNVNSSERMRIDSSGNVGIGTTSPDRSLDVEGTGMAIFGTGDYTELMLRGQVEGTGTVRNVGSWHWSLRADVGGDNDDLKLLRFVTGSYAGIAMQVQNSTGDIFFGNTVVNPASGFSNQRGLGYDNSTGNLEAASTSGTAMTIGRNEASDGQILQLRKESTIKHSFGSTTSYLYGNVGIGTTSPQFPLNVVGASATEVTVARFSKGNYADSGGHTTIVGLGTESSIAWTKAAIAFERTGGYDTGNIHFLQEDTIDNSTAELSDSVMTITKTGNVGIGTNSPSQLLHVNSSTNNATGIGLQNSERYYSVRSNNFSLVFTDETVGTERMRITSAGDVAIGSTDAEKRLEVKSDTTYDGILIDTLSAPEIVLRDRGNSDTLVGTGRHALDGFHIDTYSGNAFFIKGSNRYVGIGTTSPGQKLEVAGRIRVTTDPTLEVYEASNKRGGFQWDSTNDYVNIFSTGGDMRFDLGGERMRITSGGALLIGQTSAVSTHLLTVNGRIGGPTFSDSYLQFTGGNILLKANDDIKLGYNQNVIVKQSGDVGIGTTSPGTKLDINSGISSSSINAIQISQNTTGIIKPASAFGVAIQNGGQNTNAADLFISTASGGSLAERMRITSGGNVGIGTTTTQARLEVRNTADGSTTAPQFLIYGGASSYGAFHFLDSDAYHILTNSAGRDIEIICDSGGVKLGPGDTSWSSNSDENLKENIKPLNNVLDKIKDYRCVEYNFKDDENEDKKIGFIAQDWQKDFSQVVNKNKQDVLSIKYTETIPVLLKAIQELEARVKELENK